MKWLISFVAFLATTLFLFADGSSGDFLLSPEHSETTTKVFGGKSDTYKDSRGGWIATGKVYARKNGAGLGKTSTGILSFDFPEESPEYIRTLTVVCSTAAEDASSKENTLVITLTTETGETLSKSFTFTTGSQTTSEQETFTFDEALPIKGMSFTNPSEKYIFELSLVSWTTSLPELEVKSSFSDTSDMTVELQGRVDVSINQVKGGSGSYAYASILFCEQLIEWDTPAFPVGYTFTAPMVSGTYPCEICIRDDEGNEKRITKNVVVTPYARPCNLQVSNITRHSFDLTWSMSSGATPKEYKLVVTEVLEEKSAKIVTAPKWTETESGTWISEPLSLIPWTHGKRVPALYGTAYNYTGNFWISLNNGTTWQKKPYLAEAYLLGGVAAAEEQSVMFKVDATPPKFLTLNLPRIVGEIKETTFNVSAQQRIQTVTGLLSGKKYKVEVGAIFDKAITDGSNSSETVTYFSDTIIVQTEALPGFTNATALTKWERFQVAWPKGESGLTGDIRIFAERSVPHKVPHGLYLTRILWTKAGGGLATSKAIVLTNISDRPIHLRGGYILKAVKRETATTYQWDFSNKSTDSPTIYPYVIPAGGELIIAHSKYLPSDLRETVVQTNVGALNFTAEWDISLWCGDKLQNTLTPQQNAVVRLAEDSLEETEVTELTENLPIIDALYNPWMNVVEVVQLATRTIEQNSMGVTMLSYSAYLENIETTRKIWAVCRTKKDADISEAIEVILWEPALRPGLSFRMR